MTILAYTLKALCAVWLLAAALIVVRAVHPRVPAACRDDAWAPEAVPIPGADEACALCQLQLERQHLAPTERPTSLHSDFQLWESEIRP